MKATVGTVMVDCNNLDGMVQFWSQVLGLDEVARYPDHVWLGKLNDAGPSLAFQRVPEPRGEKNRIHLDLTAADPAAFIERVLELGGSRIEDHEISGFHWTVLADPEGNVFCVTPPH